MGRRGPPKTPTAQLEERGSPVAKERKGEPKPKAGAPKRPAWLSPKASPHWTALGPALESLKVLTIADAPALALLCDALVDYLEAREAASKAEPVTVSVSEGGGERHYLHPSRALVASTSDRVLKLLREFGLTPASRAGVTVVDEVLAGKGKHFA